MWFSEIDKLRRIHKWLFDGICCVAVFVFIYKWIIKINPTFVQWKSIKLMYVRTCYDLFHRKLGIHHHYIIIKWKVFWFFLLLTLMKCMCNGGANKKLLCEHTNWGKARENEKGSKKEEARERKREIGKNFYRTKLILRSTHIYMKSISNLALM